MPVFLSKYLITVPVTVSGHGEPQEGKGVHQYPLAFWQTAVLFKSSTKHPGS